MSVARFNLRANTMWGLAEVVASALTLFLTYRMIVGNLGVGALGIWALVGAAAGLTRFADIGVGIGLTRFVARSLAGAEGISATTYIFTGALFNTVVFAAAAVAFYYPAIAYLRLSIEGADLATALDLFPIVLLNLPASVLGTTLLSGIVGLHRSDLKSLAVVGSQLAGLIFFAATLQSLGILAAGYGQWVQSVVMIAVGILLTFFLHTKGTSRRPFSFAALRNILSFGFRVQAAGLTAVLIDPLVKYMLSLFGGTVSLGYFEMAQRFVLQARQLVNGPSQVLVPAFSGLVVKEVGLLRDLYTQSLAVAIGVGAPIMAACILFSPVISVIWIGSLSHEFVAYTFMMAVGWWFSLYAVPGYLLAVSIGKLRWNIFGNLLCAALVVMLGYPLGSIFKAHGVVLAFAISLAISGLTMSVLNSRLIDAAYWPGIRRIIDVIKAMLFRTLIIIFGDRGRL